MIYILNTVSHIPISLSLTPQPVYDWHLGLFVGGLVLADLLILTTYTAVEGSKGKLTASLVPSLERTVDVQGVGEIINTLHKIKFNAFAPLTSCTNLV